MRIIIHYYYADVMSAALRFLLVRPSVCPSVPFGIRTRKHKSIKTKVGPNVP